MPVPKSNAHSDSRPNGFSIEQLKDMDCEPRKVGGVDYMVSKDGLEVYRVADGQESIPRKVRVYQPCYDSIF